jgi:hypothetical protein
MVERVTKSLASSSPSSAFRIEEQNSANRSKGFLLVEVKVIESTLILFSNNVSMLASFVSAVSVLKLLLMYSL